MHGVLNTEGGGDEIMKKTQQPCVFSYVNTFQQEII